MSELPVIQFIQERLAESDANLETRPGSAFYDLFIKPQQLLLDPLFTNMDTLITAQSLRRIQSLPDPNAFDESLVDDLVSNFYIERRQGALAKTVVRVFYDEPLDREFPVFGAEFTAGDVSFFNSAAILVTRQTMATQQSGRLYYMDVPVEAQLEGIAYNVTAGAITRFVNDPDAVRVTNISSAIGGLEKETNLALISRAKNSIGVRDLETVKGINATLLTNFPYLKRLHAVGMGDPEMMRDVVFNTHVGGATDVYLASGDLTLLSEDFFGVDFDTTRSLKKQTYLQLTAKSLSDESASLGTPFIVPGTIRLKDDLIETPASIESTAISSSGGLDLSQDEWIKLSVNGRPAINIKVSGPVPVRTRRSEIVNAINTYTGVTVAFAVGSTRLRITTLTAGETSTLTFFKPDGQRTDGTLTLFPELALEGYLSGAASPTCTVHGESAKEYVENYDFVVDYDNGKIAKTADSTILSGELIASSTTAGLGQVFMGGTTLSVPGDGAFVNVRSGDIITVTVGTGLPPGQYVVQSKISNEAIKLLGVVASSDDTNIQFELTSNQALILEYAYHPLSIDIGRQVLLSDGVTRGVRPGREAATLQKTPFISIQSIEEIDPDSGDLLGITLVPPGGYGSDGYGSGGYGLSHRGDYTVKINDASSRYSVHEDSLIVFNPSLFGRSYRINYLAVPEIQEIHDFCRKDSERVMGADILPKSFVPALISMDITVVRDRTNIDAPTASQLISLIQGLVRETEPGEALEASEITAALESAGVKSVDVPFTMHARVLNTDGSTTLLSDTNLLQLPAVTLPKLTDNYVTPRIVQFFPDQITITEI